MRVHVRHALVLALAAARALTVWDAAPRGLVEDATTPCACDDQKLPRGALRLRVLFGCGKDVATPFAKMLSEAVLREGCGLVAARMITCGRGECRGWGVHCVHRLG